MALLYEYIVSRSLGCMYVSNFKEVSGIVVGLFLHASVIALVKFTSFLLLIAHSLQFSPPNSFYCNDVMKHCSLAPNIMSWFNSL